MRTLLPLLLLAACSGKGDPERTSAPTPPGTTSSPTPTDSTAPTPAVPITELSFALQGLERLRLPIDGLQLGVVEPDPDDELSYAPKYIDDSDVRWLSPVSATQVATATGSVVTLDYDDGLTATLTVTVDTAQRWSMTWQPEGLASLGDDPLGFYRIVAVGDATEEFYGLGEYFDQPFHRGKARDLHLDVDLSTESGYNEAHVPIPLVLGTTGWGLFVPDDHPMRFEMALEADDEVVITVGTGVDSAAGLTLHAFVEAQPIDLTRHYYELTGFPALPAPWALGPLFWRDETTGQAEVLGDMAAMRDLDIAATGIWIDRPYASAVNSFDFEPANYSDPQAMIDAAHAQGFRFGLWHTPYVEESTGALHQHAVDNGYFPELPFIVEAVLNWGAPIDLSNPAAYDWWRGNVEIYTDMGVEGFKLDFAEEVIPGVLAGRLPWVFHDGSDERTMHRQYQRLYHQVYREALGDGVGFLLCRTGAWGDQATGTIIWPGDIDGNLAYHGEDMGEYVAVGGLPAAVSASIGLGPSGFPFFGSDTGGYRHTPPDKETFTRWFEHTALSSVMQIGMSSSDVAWEPVRDWDEAMLDDYRFYSRLHLRLFPYLWTYAHQLETTGRPLQRPLGLAHPELGEHPAFDYLLGADLLVAPVVRPGETTRRVRLPEGDWADWFDLDVLPAGEHTVSAPLSKIPLFLRRGGIVPMLRDTIDTLSPVADPAAVDSFATDPGRLTVRVFPGDPSELVLYDGSVVSQEATANGAILSFTAGSVFTAGADFEVMGGSELVFASVDG